MKASTRRPPTRRTAFTDTKPPFPWRSTTPVVKACLEDLARALDADVMAFRDLADPRRGVR